MTRVIQSDTANVQANLRVVYSTSGVPVTITDSATNASFWYYRPGAAVVAVSLTALATHSDSHSDGGWLSMANGEHRFDVPDAAFATGASMAIVGGGADDVVVIGEVFQIVGYNPASPTLGMTVPSTTANASACRAEMDSASTELASIVAQLDIIQADTTLIVAASAVATAVWEHGTRDLTSSTNFALVSVVGVRTEMDSNSTQLASIVAQLDVIQADTTLIVAASAVATAAWEHGARVLTGANEIVTAVWDATAVDYATSGSMGEAVQAAGAAASAIATAVWEHGTRALSSAAEIVTAVWDATAVDYATSGSMGEAVQASAAAASAIATAVWEHGTRDLTSATNFNNISVSNIYDDVRSGLVYEGTLTGAAASNVTVTANSFTTNELIGGFMWVKSGTGNGQGRAITANTSNVLSVQPDWQTTPTGAQVRVVASAPQSDDSETAIATAVWEHGTRDLTSSTNFALLAVGDIFNATSSSYATADTMGELVNQIASLSTQLDVVQADTTLIDSVVEAVITDAVGTNIGSDTASLVAQLDVIQADTTLIVAASAIASAVKDASLAELSQGAPSATPTVEQLLMLLYMALRNKRTTTATEDAIYNDAGTKIAKATLTDDGTTFTRDEMVSGA